MKHVRLKTYVFLCVCGVLFTWAAQSLRAQGITYFRFDVGPSWVQPISINKYNPTDYYYDQANEPKIKFNTGVRADIVFGVNLSRVFALEVNTAMLYNSVSSVDVGHPSTGETHLIGESYYQVPLFLNGMFTLLPNHKIHPYIGAGLGGLFSVSPDVVDSDSYTGAFQFLVGCKYNLTERLDVGLGYTFMAAVRQNRLFSDYTADWTVDHSVVAALTVHL